MAVPLTVIVSIFGTGDPGANAQSLPECSQYQLVPKTVYRPKKTTTYKLVEETDFVKEKTTTYKPVWKEVQRSRPVTETKPVEETRYREEKSIEYERVVETAYRDEVVEETIMETRTEMRDQERIVEHPVTETRYREEKIVVQKPVVETQMRSEQTTVFRPETVAQTQWVPAYTTQNTLAYSPGRVRNRLQWLRAGHYPDASGQLRYRTGGFYWVPQQNVGRYAVQPQTVPSAVPQTVLQQQFVPQQITTQKPVEVTRMVDQIETRRIPYEVQTTQKRVVVEKVPVEVKVPVKKQTVRRVPYERVRLVPKEVVRKVPYQETVYKTVQRDEPYTVRVQEYVTETSERTVPRRITKRIPVENTVMVPETVVQRIPLDPWGNPLVSTTTQEPVAPTTTIHSLEAHKPAIPSTERGKVYVARPTVVDQASPNDGQGHDGQRHESKKPIAIENELDAGRGDEPLVDVRPPTAQPPRDNTDTTDNPKSSSDDQATPTEPSNRPSHRRVTPLLDQAPLKKRAADQVPSI